MARQPLYNIYRPSVFADVVEQDAIKKILLQELNDKNLKHVLLFTGPAGCGKTTSGRIFAKEIESIKSNVIEINCADHTGVDDVRTLVLDASKTKPLQGEYKIFILDEAHMLTIQAQNALLKILEEPPKHCIYIMCTTDPQKVLPTILSRSFRYDFQLISQKGIIERLQYVCEKEKALGEQGCGIETWDDSSLEAIANSAMGHLRNALATLEKCIAYDKHLTVDVVTKVLGVTNYDILFKILGCIISKNPEELLKAIQQLSDSGMDLKLFIKNFLTFVLDVNKFLIMKTETNDLSNLHLSIPMSYMNNMINYNASHREIFKSLLTKLLELNSSMRWETNVKPVLETNLLLEVI